MALNRQRMFNKPLPRERQLSARSGVFGGQGRKPVDRTSPGLQKARNATAGKIKGGRLPAQRTPQAAAQNKRKQLFTQRVGSLRNRTNTPKPRRI